MTHKRSIIDLVSNIVATEFPNEKDIYEIFEDDIFDNVSKGKSYWDMVAGTGAQNGFLETAAAIINSISVAAATIKTILEIRKYLKEKKEKNERLESIRELWLKMLLEENLGKEMAERIAVKYHDELEKIVSE